MRVSAIHIWNLFSGVLFIRRKLIPGQKAWPWIQCIDIGNLTTINFAEGEDLVGLEGALGYSFVNQLAFHTKKQDGSNAK